jgi:hypothetical protein
MDHVRFQGRMTVAPTGRPARRRWWLPLLPGLALLDVASAGAFDELVGNRTYDRYFKQYAARYFGPDFDWRIFKAQAIAESLDAVPSADYGETPHYVEKVFRIHRRMAEVQLAETPCRQTQGAPGVRVAPGAAGRTAGGGG